MCVRVKYNAMRVVRYTRAVSRMPVIGVTSPFPAYPAQTCYNVTYNVIYLIINVGK